MTTIPATDSWFKRTTRSIRIPPVYLFLIVTFLVSGLLDQIYSDGQILSNPAIMLNIIVRSVALGIVAVGQTLVILGASIDLSVAYTISITAVMSSYIMQGETANVPIALVAIFGIGIVIGLANGLIITKLKVNPFIATLGMSLIIKGIINATFSNYTGSVPKSFEYFGYGTIGPIPVSILIMLLVFVIGWFIGTDKIWSSFIRSGGIPKLPAYRV
jgi:ribose transport system permease protein